MGFSPSNGSSLGWSAGANRSIAARKTPFCSSPSSGENTYSPFPISIAPVMPSSHRIGTTRISVPLSVSPFDWIDSLASSCTSLASRVIGYDVRFDAQNRSSQGNRSLSSLTIRFQWLQSMPALTRRLIRSVPIAVHLLPNPFKSSLKSGEQCV